MGITVKKSYKDGHVSVRVLLKARSYSSDHIKIEGDTDLKSSEARELAAALIDEANKTDAKTKAKAASDERRRKYREREIAAGRLKVFSNLG